MRNLAVSRIIWGEEEDANYDKVLLENTNRDYILANIKSLFILENFLLFYQYPLYRECYIYILESVL